MGLIFGVGNTTNEYYGYSPNKFVEAGAGGGGAGTEGDPWTLAEAMSSAVAGDIVGIKPGTYVGSDPVTNRHFTPAFYPANSGSSGSPIRFVAQWPAYIYEATSSLRTDIRSGGTTQASGWPAFGVLNEEYIEWIGIYSDSNDTNNKAASDSGTVTVRLSGGTAPDYCKIIGCRFIGQTGQSDNYSAIRFENADFFEAFDNVISGYESTVNNAGFIVYKARLFDIHHNTIYDCEHGIQLKGADGSTTIHDYDIHKNIIRDCAQAFRIGGTVKGPSSEESDIYQNIVYDCTEAFEWTSSGHTGEQDGMNIFNNVFYNTTSTYRLGHSYQTEGTVPRDNRIFNNIIHTTTNYYRGEYATVSTRAYWDDYADFEYNCIYNDTNFGNGSTGSELDSLTLSSWQSTESQELNAVTSDPSFTNTTTKDFTLQGGSSARSAGIDRLGKFGTVDATIHMGVYVNETETIGARV